MNLKSQLLPPHLHHCLPPFPPPIPPTSATSPLISTLVDLGRQIYRPPLCRTNDAITKDVGPDATSGDAVSMSPLNQRMLRYSILKNATGARTMFSHVQVRGMHSRNKTAMEFIAKGWSAMKEVDRVIDYCELNDKRLIPLLRGAKENFELALEVDNSNTHARYWLSKLHLKYHVPGACKAVGAALLVEAAEMGNSDALYELGSRLRVENEYVQSAQQAFYYIEKAVEQLHPGALYLLGAVYLTGECAQQDFGSAMWCFHRAAEKGHAGAAIAYGSLLLQGYQVPESITKFNVKKRSKSTKKTYVGVTMNHVEKAKEQFQIAASAGCDLGFKWLSRLEEAERRLLSEQEIS